MASVSIENLLKGLSDEDLKELSRDVDPSVVGEHTCNMSGQ